MFIGHFAVGFAMKKVAPRASLGALIAAPIFLDLLWPIFLLTGIEQVKIDPGNTAFTPLDFTYYPFSHSLLAAVGWATFFAMLYQRMTRYTPGAIWIWIGVVSHWVFDAVVHRPDLPLYPGTDLKVGFGLWNSPIATILLEGSLFIAGVWIYASLTHPTDKAGRYGFWAFVGLLIFLYIGAIKGSVPENTTALAVFALTAWLCVPWAWWFDRHRMIS